MTPSRDDSTPSRTSYLQTKHSRATAHDLISHIPSLHSYSKSAYVARSLTDPPYMLFFLPNLRRNVGVRSHRVNLPLAFSHADQGSNVQELTQATGESI